MTYRSRLENILMFQFCYSSVVLSTYSSLNSFCVQQDDTQLDKVGILLVLNSKESLSGKSWVRLGCSLFPFLSPVLSETIAASRQWLRTSNPS